MDIMLWRYIEKIRYRCMDVQRIVEALSCKSGIVSVVVPDGPVLNEIFEMEACIEDTSFGMPMDNRALEACKSRSMHVIVFCEYTFEPPTDHVMIMEDENGNMVGFDIPVGRQEEYIDRTDIVMLSDDFALLANAESDIAKVVMLPQDAKCIGAEEGIRDPVIFYPATTTDMYIKDKYGVDISASHIASALISFDRL